MDLDRAALVWAGWATREPEVSNISVEDKVATSVVIGALKMKRNY